jgi:hypothetical protein
MNYNTETINQMAQELAEMFKTAVIAQQEGDGRTPAIAEIEINMREALGMFLRTRSPKGFSTCS